MDDIEICLARIQRDRAALARQVGMNMGVRIKLDLGAISQPQRLSLSKPGCIILMHRIMRLPCKPGPSPRQNQKRCGNQNWPEPDISFIRKELVRRFQRGQAIGPPPGRFKSQISDLMARRLFKPKIEPIALLRGQARGLRTPAMSPRSSRFRQRTSRGFLKKL